MTPLDIRKALLDAGTTGAAIARDIGCQRQQVSTTINGHSRTPYIRRAIADAIGRPYEWVWGERDPGQDRLRPGRAVNSVDTFTQFHEPGVADRTSAVQ